MNKTLTIVAVLATTVFYAQNQAQAIDTVQIQGRTKVKKERSEFKKHAQSTEILSSYELNRNTNNFIEQSLGTLSGVQVDKRTTVGGQRIVVRGYGNDQKFNNWGVKMYLNNFPLTNADGVTNLEDVDFTLINHIDVIKGPASTLYGGGVGGTLRFYIQPEAVKGTSLSQSFMGGSFKTFQSATRVDAVSENSSVMLNYNHFESDGYRPRGTSNRNNYTFLGNFKLNSKQNLEVYAAHNNTREGVPGQISYADYYAGIDDGNLAYARRNARNIFVSTRFSVTHQWKILPELENKTSIFYGSLETDRKAAGAYENTISPTYGFRTAFVFEKKLGENFRNNLEVGAEHFITKALTSNYRYTGTNPNVPDEVRPMDKNSYFKYNNFATSIFAVDRITYEPWDLTFLAGISYNTLGYNRNDLLAVPGAVASSYKDQSFQKDFKPTYAPHFALQKSFGSHLLNLSYSEGFNAPTAATAFVSGTGKANDDLKTEHAKMWDLSAHGLFADTIFDYQVSLFSMNISNKLTQLSGRNYTYWANKKKKKNKGLELSLGYVENFDSGFFKKIEPYFNYSLYDFKYDNFVTNGKNYSGKEVVGVPKHKASLGLDFTTHSGFYLYNTFNYLDRIYTDFANTTKVKAYHQLNIKLGYKKSFGQFEMDAYVMGNNLTNRINYTFVFLGNSVGDNDPDSQYPQNVATDITPGPKSAYFFGGLNMKYRF